MNWSRLWAMAEKERRHIQRDPRSLLLAFVLPMVLILFFGYAISFDVTDIQLAALDQDHTAASRELLDGFESSGYFRVTQYLNRHTEVEALFARNRVRAALVIPPGFASAVAHGDAVVQLLIDGSDANTATIVQNYADVIAARFHAAGNGGPIDARVRVWYNETLESVNMIVPGLVAVIMSIIAALLTALTIAREWERGTMEQLAATPVGRFEVVAGKLVPYIAIGIFDVTLAVLAGILVFDVPLRGNIGLLAGFTLLFLIGALAFGMFLSATLKSQVLSTQAAMLTTYLPALLLSGFLFAIANMPIVLRAVTFLVPARYYIVVTRGIFLKDVGLSVLWPEAVALVIFAAGGLGLATRQFRKEIA